MGAEPTIAAVLREYRDHNRISHEQHVALIHNPDGSSRAGSPASLPEFQTDLQAALAANGGQPEQRHRVGVPLLEEEDGSLASSQDALPAPSDTSHAASRAPLTFESLRQLGYNFLAVALRGSKVTDSSSLDPDALGKTPTLHADDGRVHSGYWPSWPCTEAQAAKYDTWRATYGDLIAVRGGRTVAFDLDLTTPEDAAAVREIIVQQVGDTVVRSRTGGSDSLLLMYQVESKMSKRRLAWRRPGGSEKEALEFLASGQYWNFVGPHPKGDSYVLDRDLPKQADLPAITEQQVTGIFETVEAWASQRGYEIEARSGSGSSTDRAKVDQSTLLARDWSELHKLIESVEEQDLDYHDWAEGMIPATLGAAGPDHRAEAEDVLVGFSLKHSEPIDPDEVLDKLRSYRPPYALGERRVLQILEGIGVDTSGYRAAEAAQDFGVPTAAAPEGGPEGSGEPTKQTPLEWGNERFALVKSLFGKVLVTEPGKAPAEWPIDHWRTMVKDRPAVGRDAFATFWLEHRGRRVFDDLIIDPSKPKWSTVRQDDGIYFNRWGGFAMEPSPTGSCELFLTHIREKVCSGNERHFSWLVQWMASMFQDPTRIPGTAPLLRGPQGVGKTMVGTVLKKIIGEAYSITIADPNLLVGTFTSQLEGQILVMGEEVVAASMIEQVGILKDKITNPVLLVHPKGVPPHKAPNVIHLLLTSNAEHAVPAGEGERRFCVFDVVNEEMSYEYFSALFEQLEEGGYGRLHHFLKNEVVIDWPFISSPVETTATRDQKLLSLDPVAEIWRSVLSEGALPCDRTPSTSDMFTHFANKLALTRDSRRALETKLGTFLHRVGVQKDRQQVGRVRRYVYVVPPLQEARAGFERWLRSSVDWDVEVDDWHSDTGPLVPASLAGLEV